MKTKLFYIFNWILRDSIFSSHHWSFRQVVSLLKNKKKKSEFNCYLFMFVYRITCYRIMSVYKLKKDLVICYRLHGVICNALTYCFSKLPWLLLGKSPVRLPCSLLLENITFNFRSRSQKSFGGFTLRLSSGIIKHLCTLLSTIAVRFCNKSNMYCWS